MSETLAEILARKVKEFEAIMTPTEYRKQCRWCAEGYRPVPSSVSEAMVHPDSPVGRVVCAYPKECFENPNEVWDELAGPQGKDGKQ